MTVKTYKLKYTDSALTPITVPRRVFVSDIIDITLIGKRTLEYGEILNDNVVHLMEHFACHALSTDINVPDPASMAGRYLETPSVGQLWYNLTADSLYSWVGTKWNAIHSFSSISGNSGFIYDGDTVPIPLDFHGNTHDINDCVINIAPAMVTANIESFICEVSPSGVVTCKFTPIGDVQRSGIASYVILCNGANKSPVTPTPTPSVTPNASMTPTPTVTRTVTRTITPTITPTITASSTASPTVTVTPTVTPTITPTPTPLPGMALEDGISDTLMEDGSRVLLE
jgi:hypothetical protein